MRTTIAARAPTPPKNGTGRRNPNIARLGMVWTTLAKPTTGVLSRGLRAARIPIGTPIATAAVVEISTRKTCCATRLASSPRCDIQKVMTGIFVLRCSRQWGRPFSQDVRDHNSIEQPPDGRVAGFGEPHRRFARNQLPALEQRNAIG